MRRPNALLLGGRSGRVAMWHGVGAGFRAEDKEEQKTSDDDDQHDDEQRGACLAFFSRR